MMRARMPTLVATLAVLTAAGCSPAPTPDRSAVEYRVVRSLPHDPQAFTQGLVIDDGVLFESTGARGSGSSIRRIDLATGRVTKRIAIEQPLFAEGLTAHRGRLYQLTWHDHRVLVYDRKLNRIDEIGYDGEAWGLTAHENHLILSDGTDELRIIDPTTFTVVRTVQVTDGGAAVTGLNELEADGADVWANVLGSPRIARIDMESGRIRSWLDLSALVARVGATDEEAVLNGIAVNPKNGHLLVTGKLWPDLFELELTS